MVTIKHIARVIRGATLCSSNNIRVNRGRGGGIVCASQLEGRG